MTWYRYPEGVEITAGDHEPPLTSPQDRDVDPLIDVVTGNLDTSLPTIHQKVAAVALLITQETEAGTSHQSKRVMDCMDELANDPDMAVLRELYGNLRLV